VKRPLVAIVLKYPQAPSGVVPEYVEYCVSTNTPMYLTWKHVPEHPLGFVPPLP
jgi:hypothetical protein